MSFTWPGTGPELDKKILNLCNFLKHILFLLAGCVFLSSHLSPLFSLVSSLVDANLYRLDPGGLGQAVEWGEVRADDTVGPFDLDVSLLLQSGPQ